MKYMITASSTRKTIGLPSRLCGPGGAVAVPCVVDVCAAGAPCDAGALGAVCAGAAGADASAKITFHCIMKMAGQFRPTNELGKRNWEAETGLFIQRMVAIVGG